MPYSASSTRIFLAHKKILFWLLQVLDSLVANGLFHHPFHYPLKHSFGFTKACTWFLCRRVIFQLTQDCYEPQIGVRKLTSMRVLMTVMGQTTIEAIDLVNAPALNVTRAGSFSFKDPPSLPRMVAASPLSNADLIVSTIGPSTAKYNPAPSPTLRHAGPVPRHSPFTPSSPKILFTTTLKCLSWGFSAACMWVLITSRGCKRVVLSMPAPPPAMKDAMLFRGFVSTFLGVSSCVPEAAVVSIVVALLTCSCAIVMKSRLSAILCGWIRKFLDVHSVIENEVIASEKASEAALQPHPRRETLVNARNSMVRNSCYNQRFLARVTWTLTKIFFKWYWHPHPVVRTLNTQHTKHWPLKKHKYCKLATSQPNKLASQKSSTLF